MINLDKDLLNKITNLPLDTKLDSQILFIELLSDIIKTPLILSILNSLIELKGIKHNQIKNLENSK